LHDALDFVTGRPVDDHIQASIEHPFLFDVVDMGL
tara:strand:+ start:733 stop:837 length:105 start_codon:yes stop_codon:yes gene_type:complete